MTATLTPPPAASAPGRQRRGLQRFVPLLLVIAGVLVLLYPVAATQFNNVKQHEFSQQYNNAVLTTPPEDLSADLAEARTYNDGLSGVPILDPWLLKVATDPGSDQYKTYMAELDRFEIMARVRVPSVAIDLPVRHGTWDEVIDNGVGHLYGTSLPVGGENTHSVLTTHTGMPNATLFDNLIDVVEGDLILVDVAGETLAYQVDQIKVVLPNEISDLTTVAGHDYLTLFTCTPYAVNTHRLLVRGERVPYTPEIAETVQPDPLSAFKLEPWMYGLIGGAVFGLTALILIVLRERRRGARRLPTSPTSPGRRFAEED